MPRNLNEVVRSWIRLPVSFPEQIVAYTVESSAGILKQSMGARDRVGKGLSYRPTRLHSPVVLLGSRKVKNTVSVVFCRRSMKIRQILDPLPFSLVQLSPPHPLPCILYTRTQCVRGGGCIWGYRLQTDKHLLQSLFTGKFFRWRQMHCLLWVLFFLRFKMFFFIARHVHILVSYTVKLYNSRP